MISMDKHYTTRDGESARVLCVDRKGNDKPVIALVTSKRDGIEYMAAYAADGKSYHDRSGDLIEVKPKRTVELWLNHYEDGHPIVHLIEPKPEHKNARCIATTHHTITFEEGEGL